MKHLDIVSSNEVLLKIDEDYFKSQIGWREEVQEKMNLKQLDVSTIQLYNVEDDLIQKRKEELKHATDIRELYEQKLEKANNLYFELSTVLVQLDQRERELIKREKDFNINNDKIVRPILKREFQDRTKSYIQKNTVNKSRTPDTNNNELDMKIDENKVGSTDNKVSVINVEEDDSIKTQYKPNFVAKLDEKSKA